MSALDLTTVLAVAGMMAIRLMVPMLGILTLGSLLRHITTSSS